MLDKGHCKINTDDGSDFEDFFDFSNGDDTDPDDRTIIRAKDAGVLIPEDDKLHLASGRSVGHRSQAYHYRQSLPSPALRAERSAIAKHQIGSGSRSAPYDHGNQLALHGYNNMGMIGVSEMGKRTMRAVEKKMLKMEARARNEYQATVEKAQNRQKFFKVGKSVCSIL